MSYTVLTGARLGPFVSKSRQCPTALRDQTVSKLQHTAVRNVTRTFNSQLGGSDRLHRFESQCSDFDEFLFGMRVESASGGG